GAGAHLWRYQQHGVQAGDDGGNLDQLYLGEYPQVWRVRRGYFRERDQLHRRRKSVTLSEAFRKIILRLPELIRRGALFGMHPGDGSGVHHPTLWKME